MKILLVEDDPPTRSALAEIFGTYRHTVNLASDGQTGLELARSFDYDLIVLDVMIPNLDGISVCQRLRQEGHQHPILLLTAKDSRSDRILGLDAGADDYVVKPFDADELMARIRALLRRGKSAAAAVITWENVKFDAASSEVTCNGQLVRLTPKEYCLLELLLLNPKRIFSRRAILDRLWDFADSPGEETVSTHIKCLRQKLKAAGAADLVETVHGLGYRLRAESLPQTAPEAVVDRSSQNRSSQNRSPQDRSPQINHQRIQDKTAKLLEQFRGRFIEQWAVLEQASIALSADALTLELQEQAKQEAHKLAGALGIFGIKSGSEYARALEQLLQGQPLLLVAQAKDVAKWVGLLRQALESKPQVAEADRPADSPLILIVDDDLLLADRVRIEAIAWGLRVEIATDLDTAQNHISQSPPDVILLDLTFPGSSEDGLAFLRSLRARPVAIPVLVFTGRGGLRDRIAVAQLGGSAFLQKPLPTCEILKAVTTVLNQRPQHSNRVLVVDDVSVLARLSSLLQPLGIEAIGLDASADFWQELTTIAPNLLLLDAAFAGCPGIELCQAVRGDPQWRDLPVLFWSDNPDAAQIDRAFAVGADDYFSKSIDAAELVTRIVRRLRRVGFQDRLFAVP